MLFGSAILEVVIGVAFVYLLLSLLCSTLNEWIAGILQLRGKTLQEGIKNLLDDRHAPDLLERFMIHPLITGLSRKGAQNFPSYIPARTFALALIDTLAPADPSAGPRDLNVVYRQLRDELANLTKANSPLAKSLLMLVDDAGGDPKQIEQVATTLQQLAQARTQLIGLLGSAGGNPTNLGALSGALEKLQALETTIKQGEADALVKLQKAQTNIEEYFNAAMDRVSGWYKRRAQIIVIVIALITTVVLNVDTIAIANQLAADSALRTVVVDAAQRYQKEGTQTVATQADSRASGASAAVTITPPATITETLTLIDQLGIPIGWKAMPQQPTQWFYKVVGLLVTTIAVSLGAPFWFGILNKLINLRMTGDKPEEKNAKED